MLVSKHGYEIPYVFEGKGDEKKIVIISHGFGSSKESPTATSVAEKLNDVGMAAVRFDFPAHGESPVEGDFFRIQNCIDDVEAVEKMVREKYPEAEISYFSSSFGAFINLLYISSREHKGTRSFLRCAAVDMPGIVEGWLEAEDMKKMNEEGFLVIDEDYVRPLKMVKEFVEDLEEINLYDGFDSNGTEILMIHGTADETAPYEDAKKFADAYEIKMIDVEGSDHRFTPEGAMDTVREAAVKFINKI